MLPVRWSAVAVRSLASVVDYVADFNPDAAEALRERLEIAVNPLSEHPYLYRPGRTPGTRELVATPIM